MKTMKNYDTPFAQILSVEDIMTASPTAGHDDKDNWEIDDFDIIN